MINNEVIYLERNGEGKTEEYLKQEANWCISCKYFDYENRNPLGWAKCKKIGRDTCTNSNKCKYFKMKKTKEFKIPTWEIIGTKMLDDYDIITLEDSKQIMIRNDHYYSFDKGFLDEKITEEITSMNIKSLSYTINETKKYIKNKTQFNRDNFIYDQSIISFKNGIWDIETNQFLDSPGIKLFYEIPYEYNPELQTQCPEFEKAVKIWLGDDNKFTLKDIYEMIGYFMSVKALKTAFLFYGETNTAKTQLANIIIHLLGGSINISTVSLQRVNSKFGTRPLEFKIANIYPEIPYQRLFNTGVFKACTGGDLMIEAEIKGGAQYSFRNSARFLFTANRIPQLENLNDDAFFERWILGRFFKQFERNDPNRIEDFYKKIINNKNEIDGIYHKSINAVHNLYKRQHFRLELYKDTKHIWNYEADPLYAFIYDFIERNPKSSIRQEEFKDNFNDFLIGKGKETYQMRTLTIDLQRFNINVKKVFGDKKRHYAGIQWKKTTQNNNEITKYDDLFGISEEGGEE